MSDIVEWLESQAGLDDRYQQAADEIDRLKRDDARHLNDYHNAMIDLKMARAEIEQLRELLEQCCGIRWRPCGHMEDFDE